jgi:gamma-glutamyltranspeptidase/glutathione hydrolase
MVATSQRAASDAGAAVLNVTEPCSTGIGGDAFALFYDGAARRVTALNGSGRAPAALTLGRVGRELAPFDAKTVTVPGAVAAWFDLVERHGALPMARLLAPAIALAEEGFAVAPITAHFWAAGAPRLSNGELAIGGRAPRAGETFRNPGLARALRAIGEGGRDAFYRGPIAGAIAHTGLLSAGHGSRPAPGQERTAGMMSRGAFAGQPARQD